MNRPQALGDRLREVRKRRGLTQRELARLSGVSASLVRKLEQDDYPARVRLETIHKLATVLQVPTTSMAAAGEASEPEPAQVEDWAPVRDALAGSAGQPPGEPTLAGLRQAFGVAVAAVTANRYADLRGLLPGLLRDADALVAVSATGGQGAARRLRSQIRQLTAYMLCQTWQFTPAGQAIDLAAGDADDELTAAAAADWRCWMLLRQGRLAAAAALAAQWADDAEPRISRASPEQLAAWGRFLIRVTAAAVRDNRPQEAAEALRLARMAAAGLGRDIVPRFNRWQVFGPVTVAMFAAQNALIQDQPALTLSIGQHLDGTGFPLPETWQRHRLDVARAHVAVRNCPEAIEVLHQTWATAPEWLAQQRQAHDTLSAVITRRRTLTPAMRELADALRLPL